MSILYKKNLGKSLISVISRSSVDHVRWRKKNDKILKYMISFLIKSDVNKLASASSFGWFINLKAP